MPALPNPVHVAADAERAGADGSELHPFALLDDAAVAISDAATWQGKILVHEGRYEHPLSDVLLPATAALEIEAGTTFAMGPGVSLHVQRNVLAIGTDAKPILFTGLEEGQHWGGVTVTAPSSPASLFEHAIFEHGYETAFNGLSRLAALSFSEASASLSHCIFRDNEGSEALHFTVGKGRVEFSEFTNNSSNALQAFDCLESIEIEHNSFIENGNDAIKVSNTTAFIHENLINGCADKGISGAEQSSANIEHNVIVGCNIGIANKNGATLRVSNNTLYGNGIGFMVFQTSASYGSGKGTFTGNIVWSSGVRDLDVDSNDETVYSYSCIENLEGVPADSVGLISKGNGCDDPLFANPDQMDFHVRSEAGRFDPASLAWVKDDVTSPCIDAGPPGTDVGDEPAPNGGRINLGYDGGTERASLSRE